MTFRPEVLIYMNLMDVLMYGILILCFVGLFLVLLKGIIAVRQRILK